MDKRINTIHKLEWRYLKEWDYDRNSVLGIEPEPKVYGSNTKVWWKCIYSGHRWRASVPARLLGNKCPHCSRQNVTKSTNLLSKYPKLCEQWDYEKNQLGPENFTPGSEKKVWWVCEKEHSWEAFVYSRTKLIKPSGCPYCSNKKVGYGNDLLTNHPELCEEWDYQKNKLGPDKYAPGSKKKVWWVCEKEHSWEAVIKNRTRNGNSCPYCSNKKVGYGNDLLTNHPELCQEWDYEKNKLGPENYTPGSAKKVWWKCSKKHSWSTFIYNRTRYNKGCPYCSNNRVGYGNDLLTNHPELCEEWDYEKNQLGPENFTPGSHKKVWWKCHKGHSWKAIIKNRSRGFGCPKCFKESSVSKASQEWLDSLGVEQREVQIGKYYVDGFDPTTNTVYEFLGDFWHGNPEVFSAQEINPTIKKSFGQLYQETIERLNDIKNMGYKLVYIWENDF